MNKKLFSVVISLIIHLVLLWMALLTVIHVAVPSSPEKMSLLHVRLSSQPNSSKSNEGQNQDQNRLVNTPEMKLSELSAPQTQKNIPIKR